MGVCWPTSQGQNVFYHVATRSLVYSLRFTVFPPQLLLHTEDIHIFVIRVFVIADSFP